MTFPEILSAVTFLIPLLASIDEGRKAGASGVLIGLVVGATLGVAAVLIMRAFFKWGARHPKFRNPRPPIRWAIPIWLVFIAFVACIVFGGCSLGVFITKLILRHAAL
jgi:ribose/xylose/arabinose/galactoside ABC-type transport system permease subunit